MRRRVFLLVIAVVAAFCALGSPPAWAGTERATNVILFIGDGMGEYQRKAAVEYLGQPLEMNRMPVSGRMTTFSAANSVTDSAAAATAISSGHKTINGRVGIGVDGTSYETILEKAKRAGLAVGMVATSSITHATPAAFAAHVFWRGSEGAIARQYLEIRPDVLFGGGKRFFTPALMDSFRNLGYFQVSDAAELNQITGGPALGLFADDGLSPVLDREGADEPNLADMTAKSLSILAQNPRGFFLLVEGSQIDWACHANDPAWAVSEVADLDTAVALARRFASGNPGTLVIVLADHETGGLGAGRGGLKVGELRKQDATSKFIARAIGGERSQAPAMLRRYAGLENLTAAELRSLTRARDLEAAISKIISARAGIVWRTSSHTGVPVPVTAEGPSAGLFAGTYDNTDVHDKILEALGL